MAARFELKNTKNGEFMFNLLAGNNEVILTSETYKQKAGALNGIESVRKNAAADERFERKTATDGQFFFVLSAANKEKIGKSELYKAKASMEKGIASVKKNAPGSPVKDITEAK